MRPSCRRTLAALTMLVATGLSACKDPKPTVETSAVTITKETQASWVRNFNPLVAPSLTRWPSTCGIYEPMMIFNVMTERYHPWLATESSWSEDNLELTFTLREGVTWSDGEPFDADDVVFTFELLKAHPALDTDAVWSFLSGVEASGRHAVTFSFSRPFVPGYVYLAHKPIVAEHIWTHVDNPVMFTNDNPVGTGPFTEVREFRDQVFVLGKNPNYWQAGKPKVDALRFPAYASNDQLALALVNGEVDWGANFIPAIDRIFVDKDPKHHGYWFPPVGNMVMLYANNEHRDLGDPRLRKAMSQAIDRELLAEVAMYGYTKPADATALSDAYASWRDPSVPGEGDWTDYDPRKAALELDALGYTLEPDGKRHRPDGETLSFELAVISGWSDWVRAAQIVARQLQKAGIDAHVKAYDFSAWFDRMQRGDFELAVGFTVKGPSPYIYYRGLMSSDLYAPLGSLSPLNWHRFKNDEVDPLFKAFEKTRDDDERRRIALQMQRAFVEHAPSIPLFPNPPWGTYNTTRFTGFPNAENPYAKLTPNDYTQPLLVLTELAPR